METFSRMCLEKDVVREGVGYEEGQEGENRRGQHLGAVFIAQALLQLLIVLCFARLKRPHALVSLNCIVRIKRSIGACGHAQSSGRLLVRKV